MVQFGEKSDLVVKYERWANMRLHPAKDGLIPFPDERTLIRRDKGGNRLRDRIDPQTGFCTGVTSPLLANGVHVLPYKRPTGASGPDVRYDSESARYYDLIRTSETEPIGLVVRLTSDGDDSLPCTRVRIIKGERSATGEPERKSTAPVQKSVSARKANDEAVRAILASHGYSGPIDRKMRRLALELIAYEKTCTGRDVTV